MKKDLFYSQKEVIERYHGGRVKFVFEGDSAGSAYIFGTHKKEDCFLPSEEKNAMVLGFASGIFCSCSFTELSSDAFWEDHFTVDYPESSAWRSSYPSRLDNLATSYGIEGQHFSLFEYPQNFIRVSDNTNLTKALRNEGYYVISSQQYEMLTMDCNSVDSSSSEYVNIRSKWCGKNNQVGFTAFDTTWNNRVLTLYQPLLKFIFQNDL
ncbi:MAG: hypothetical protein IB617_02565 [Candidatus Nealsonbacteria bacterium]|nr:MAG: hypothetical protein IB617_02565 [Candidatus Nealsonbacteria bacterium]